MRRPWAAGARIERTPAAGSGRAGWSRLERPGPCGTDSARRPLMVIQNAAANVLGRNIRNDLAAHFRAHPFFSVPIEASDHIQQLIRELEQIEDRDRPR